MPWSNKSDRDRLTVEKSHSLSIAVRIEDRMHVNIVQATDSVVFTVRDSEFVVGAVDTDAIVTVEAVQTTSLELGTYFRIDVQAIELNLDPELEYWYDITYVRDGYSTSLIAGIFEVAANVTNQAAGDNFTGGSGAFTLITTIQDRNVLVVENVIPMPAQGETGLGAYETTEPLDNIVGEVVVVNASTIQSYGRPLQVGDIIFSPATRGIMGLISDITAPLVTITTVQVYGLESQKAILDLALRDTSFLVIDSTHVINKSDVPMPPGYPYTLGDMVFSKIDEVSTYKKYMVISTLAGETDFTISIQPKIVFPMFIDAGTLADTLSTKVDKAQTINGLSLTSDITLSADNIPSGSEFTMMTLAEKTKLGSVASGATANASNAYLLARSNHTGETPLAAVTGLQAALWMRPSSNTIQDIWSGTQAEYDLVNPKLSTTLYFIKA